MIEEIKGKELSCIWCKSTFTWTSDEQTVFHEKGLPHPPKALRGCEQDRTVAA